MNLSDGPNHQQMLSRWHGSNNI